MKIRNYKYRIRMNRKFLVSCEATLNICRELYNAGLQQRKDIYRQQNKSISWLEQCRQLTEAREISEVGGVLRNFQTQTLKKLDRSFSSFFRQIKRKEKPGYPRFKGYDRYDSFTTADSREFKVEGDKLSVYKLGSARLRLSRPLGGKTKQLTIKREHDGWYAVFACELPRRDSLSATGLSVGIDVGLESFATLSNGESIESPRFFRRSEAGLADAQRRLALKKRGGRLKCEGHGEK